MAIPNHGNDFVKHAALEESGWVLIDHAYPNEQLEQLRKLSAVLSQQNDVAVRAQQGQVYAARNVLDLCPELSTLWRTEALVQIVLSELGPNAGLVRALYFDKPPEQTWALPWHKDLLIAVSGNGHPPGYSKPRLRAGVLHTEPPVEILERMLTLRIHLDAMTESNGPLEVLSGSHRTGKSVQLQEFTPVQIQSAAGGVLAMRPLLVHSSGRSEVGTSEHRRVLHLEFCGEPTLARGLSWHAYIPVSPTE